MRLLTGSDLVELHRAAGSMVADLTHDYIGMIASTRHATAERLGAAPTGFFGRAADKVSMTADPSGATVTINHPGFIRAFRTVEIVPSKSKYLAIPINAISYGHRAIDLWAAMNLFIPKGKRVIAATIGGVLTPLYALCKSVTQKQDRSLLPSDADFQDAAVKGARQCLFQPRGLQS